MAQIWHITGAKLMSTITERKGKKGKSYKVQVRRRGHPTQTETFDTKAKAERWGRSVEAEMDAGRFVSLREAERTTLEAALQRYEDEEVPKKAHPEKERSFIRHWKAQKISKRMLASVRSSDFSLLRDQWLREGEAPSTVTRRLAVISHVFSVARKEWNFTGLTNPLADVSKPTVSNGRERVIKSGPAQGVDFEDESEVDDEEPIDRANLASEIERLVACTKSIWLAPAMNFAVETAMRRSEIASLKWSNVQIRARVAHLPKTKNGSSRDVPLSPAAVAILQEMQATAAGSQKVFSVRADALTRAFSRALERARAAYVEECANAQRAPDETFLVGLRFHDLRHEATTRLARIFAMHELAKITGHKSSKMLLRYYHPRAEDLARRFPDVARVA
jgi:integrase